MPFRDSGLIPVSLAQHIQGLELAAFAGEIPVFPAVARAAAHELLPYLVDRTFDPAALEPAIRLHERAYRRLASKIDGGSGIEQTGFNQVPGGGLRGHGPRGGA